MNFFRTFSRWFDESDVTFRFYQKIEKDLSFIPAGEWPNFAAKVGAVVNCRDRAGRRDWEKLFDVFNEAIGARVLMEYYQCEEVRLLSVGKTKSCDWFGLASGKPHYVEVKTLNHSNDERRSWYNETKLEHTSIVPQPLIAKAKSSYEKAKRQINAMPNAAVARKAVVFVVYADHNFDPFDRPVQEMLLEEFEKFEEPEYFIHLAIYSLHD